MEHKITKIIEDDGKKYEVTFEEASRQELTKQNLAENILEKYISDATVIEDIILELKDEDII